MLRASAGVRSANLIRHARAPGVLVALVLVSSTMAVPGLAAGGGGEVLWVSDFNGPLSVTDRPAAITVDPDGGRLFVTGLVNFRGVRRDVGTISLDAGSGSTMWSQIFNGAADNRDAGADVVVSPDGATAYVTGYSFTSGVNDEDYVTIAYDTGSGAARWLQLLDWLIGEEDSARAIAISPDGARIFVTGTVMVGDIGTVAYEAATGAQLWTAIYDGGNGTDNGDDIAVSPDGTRVFVTGTSVAGPNGLDYATIAYDAATGDQVWIDTLDGTTHGSDSAIALALTPDGSTLVVTGSMDAGFRGDNYGTVAYDAVTGNRMWARQYDGARGPDIATAMAMSQDGSAVYVTGRSWGGDATGVDYATVAYETTTGTVRWEARRSSDGMALDVPRAVAASPDGSSVFVTGEFAASTFPDFGTFADDAATGTELWNAIHDGGQRDFAEAVVVAPDGSAVYVTGSSRVLQSGFDYVTVAYAT